MISCLGLIVGTITSGSRNTLCEQCLEFCVKHKHLLQNDLIFQVENIDYVRLADYTETEDGSLFGYFRFMDGDVKVVTVPLD